MHFSYLQCLLASSQGKSKLQWQTVTIAVSTRVLLLCSLTHWEVSCHHSAAPPVVFVL